MMLRRSVVRLLSSLRWVINLPCKDPLHNCLAIFLVHSSWVLLDFPLFAFRFRAMRQAARVRRKVFIIDKVNLSGFPCDGV